MATAFTPVTGGGPAQEEEWEVSVRARGRGAGLTGVGGDTASGKGRGGAGCCCSDNIHSVRIKTCMCMCACLQVSCLTQSDVHVPEMVTVSADVSKGTTAVHIEESCDRYSKLPTFPFRSTTTSEQFFTDAVTSGELQSATK